MKARLLVLVFLLLVPAAAWSQTVVGVVVEDGTDAPIADAVVTLLTRDSRVAALAATDSTGAFLLKPPRGGVYTIRLTHPAYAALESNPLIVQHQESIQVEVRMGQAAIVLEPLRVVARADSRVARFRERAERSGFGRFLTRDQIEARAGGSVTDLLWALPEIEIVRARPGITGPSGNAILVRGALRRCVPTVYIDGVRAPADAIDDFLSPELLEGVEVYRGSAGVPAELASWDSCGVVAFWTRPGSGTPLTWKRLLAAASILALMLAVAR